MSGDAMSDEALRQRVLDAEGALTDVIQALLKDVRAQDLRGKTLLHIERLRTARFLITSVLI